MKVGTFYLVFDENNGQVTTTYAENELHIVKEKMIKLARLKPGSKFHLMKRVSSVVANDLMWEDSE